MYGVVIEFPSIDQSFYDAVNALLGISDDDPVAGYPDGLLSHAGGPTPDGWIVMEVWESKEAQETFMASRLGPALAEAGVPAPSRVTDSNLVKYQAFSN